MSRRVLPWLLILTAPLLPPARLTAQDLDSLFDDSVLQELRIRIAPADWAAIHENYLDNTYYHCDLAWNGVSVPNIGMRSRGSQSRSPVKPSIGLDFSRYATNQRFLGLKSLVLRNLNQDASMMRERLAEALFRRAGLPYSREAHARLYVNDEYVGLYLLVEPIDERFLATRFGEDTGFLYQLGYTSPPFRFEFRGPDPDAYLPVPFEPKTRTRDPATAAGIVDIVRTINEAPDARFLAEAGQVVDLPAFLAHAAAEAVLAEWDGLLGSNGMNNFYLYRPAAGGPALPLVWDQDGAFTDENWPVFKQTAENTLFRRALQFPASRRRFADALRQAAAALGGEDGWLRQEVERIYQQIRPAVYDDPVRLCRVEGAPGGIGACTIAMFEESVASLRAFALRRRAIVEAQVDAGEPAWPLEPTSIVNLLSGQAALVPGALARVAVPLPLAATVFALRRPLPATLAGFTLETSAGPASLLSVGPDGVVFVVPDALRLGPTPVRLTRGADCSNWLMVLVQPAAGGVAGLLHAYGGPVSEQAPASPGEILAAFGTGLWLSAAEQPATRLTASVSGHPANILWAGPAPGWVGLQQVNFVVPPDAPARAVLKLHFDGETAASIPLPLLEQP